MGGLLFELAQDTKAQNLEKDGLNFSVHNRIEYAVAIQLNNEETEKSINKTPLKLNGTTVESYPTQPQVHALIQNTNANIVRDVAVYYEVLSQEKVIFHGNISAFNVAPKSKVGLSIPWKAKEYKDGKYTLKVTIKENGIPKTYTEQIHITASNVTEYAEQTGAVKVLPGYSNQIYNSGWCFYINRFNVCICMVEKETCKSEGGKEGILDSIEMERGRKQ